jgi:hypothetical protein
MLWLKYVCSRPMSGSLPRSSLAAASSCARCAAGHIAGTEWAIATSAAPMGCHPAPPQPYRAPCALRSAATTRARSAGAAPTRPGPAARAPRRGAPPATAHPCIARHTRLNPCIARHTRLNPCIARHTRLNPCIARHSRLGRTRPATQPRQHRAASCRLHSRAVAVAVANVLWERQPTCSS